MKKQSEWHRVQHFDAGTGTLAGGYSQKHKCEISQRMPAVNIMVSHSHVVFIEYLAEKVRAECRKIRDC
jgi:hypothetical protein